MRKYVLGILLLITVIGTVEGIDYSQLEEQAIDLLEGSPAYMYRTDVDITEDRVLIDYRTDEFTEDGLLKDGFYEDIIAVTAIYILILDECPNAGDLKAKIRKMDGTLVGAYSCKNLWAKNVDAHDTEMVAELIKKVVDTIKSV